MLRVFSGTWQSHAFPSREHFPPHRRSQDEDVAEALRRLPPDVIMARNARLRRAIDLDLKHDHLHGDLLAQQTPAESYLQVCLKLS